MRESRLACAARGSNRFWFPRHVSQLSHEEGQALIDEARAGSRKAHEQLLTYFRPKMMRFFAPRVPRKIAARIGPEDLAQRACLLAWQHFDDFHGEFAKYCEWLWRICRNLLNAVLRRFEPGNKRDISREELLDAAALEAMQPHCHRRQQTPDEIVVGLEVTAAVETALDELPPDERQIVRWRMFDGVSFIEIAQRLDWTRHAVERTFRCVMARLQEKLIAAAEPAAA
jgi:RNA polymerase sigma-70 factor, ECF subfamily